MRALAICAVSVAAFAASCGGNEGQSRKVIIEGAELGYGEPHSQASLVCTDEQAELSSTIAASKHAYILLHDIPAPELDQLPALPVYASSSIN